MKGLTRVIVLAACIGALNFIPKNGHCQDQPVNNPGLFEESDQNSKQEKNPEAKQEENKYKSPYHDDELFGDSANRLGTTNAWQHIKDWKKSGHGMNSRIGGGGTPDDPGPDPDAPFDGGITLLLIIGLYYGYKLHRKYKAQVVTLK